MKVTIITIEAKEFATVLVCSVPVPNHRFPNCRTEQIKRIAELGRFHLGQAELTQEEKTE